MDDKLLDRLFSGDVEKLIPFPRRVVRLFISSTFTDMTLERNSLMERVYPKLKKYCREKHGLDFQVVDMRWGVRDEATDDHQTATLCSREIDNCQRVSLGPNFVALIGDKYGFRPLLNRIKSSEYRALRRCLIELDINTDFLDTWYKEDLNAVPPEYLLQPISSILKNFTNRNEPELQSVDQRIWMAIQERLHELLLIGSSRLVKQGRMSEREQLMKYSISVTEREVIEGCLDVNEAKSHCLIYVRSITDLKLHLEKCLATLEAIHSTQSPAQQTSLNASSLGDERRRSSASSLGETRKASLKIGEDSISLTKSNAQTASGRRAEKVRRLIGKYIDLRSKDDKWEMDSDAQMALDNLRSNKLASKLPANNRNLTHYEVHWSENDGLTLKSDEHKNYLNELTEHFYSNLTRMIRKASKQEQSIKSGLIGEVLQHSHYAKHVSKTFHGRRGELDKIRAYVLCPFEFGAIPMFIYGVDGSGKTSISARAATLAKNWILASEESGISQNDDNKWNQRPCVIMRFCCTTPNSSSMIGVLTSVCRQLQYNFYQYGPLNGVINQLGDNLTDLSVGMDASVESQLPYERVPEDFVRLVFTFRRLLDNCQHQHHKNRRFIIVLDSVDRLSSPAESSIEVKYSWLTSIVKLPPNVRLIVSCSSDISSVNVEDFKYLKRHFLELNHNYRKHSANLSSLDSIVDEDSDYDQENEGLLSQPVSPDFLLPDHNSSQKLTEIAVDRYRFVKRVIVPAVRLMSKAHKTIEPSTSDRGSRLNTEQRWSVSPTFGLDNLLAPRRRDSSYHRETGSGLERAARTSFAVPRESLDDVIEDLKNPSRAQSNWILHVKPMGVLLAIGVVQRWLSEHGRTLTKQQWRILETSFGHCSRPIFVKLAFGEVLNWKSYSTQSDARGLTFGSALLGNEDLAKSVKLDGDGGEIESALQRLIGHCVVDANNEFIWQVLTMEQQWQNYLDYRQRQHSDSDERNADGLHQQQDGSVVITVGAQTGGVGGAIGGSALSTSGGSLSSSICHLSNTINNAICQLFARIELQHGYILTKHSLSYITAARNGICENELEDILSLDDVVLDDVFQYHLPPVRRIPPLLWTRIRNDLPDYLSERDADGMIVINWHHSQFKQVTLERYLADPKQQNYIYSTMADYFLGKWADKPKPFRCTKQQIQMAAEQLESAVQQSIRDSQSAGVPRASLSGGRLAHGGSASVRTGTSFSVRNRLRSSDQRDSRLQWMQAKADRRVPHQPLYYNSNLDGDERDGAESNSVEAAPRRTEEPGENVSKYKRKYNLRKLTELPHHLMCSGRFVDLANHVMFNYNWLSAAIDSTGLQTLLGDFRRARAYMDSTIEAKQAMLDSQDVDMDLTPRLNFKRDQLSEFETISEMSERPFETDALRSLMQQMDILSSALRLSSSAVHSDTQMLAPQLLGRLLPLIRRSRLLDGRAGNTNNVAPPSTEYLELLLNQCDKDGSNDCSLLPIDHCLQSPDGLQLSSLEGHLFAVMSMAMAADQRHLLAVSNKFIMWDISTGEVARDIDPKIEGSIMLELRMGLNNKYAIAYTSDNIVIVLDILTQQVAKYAPRLNGKLIGMSLIDRFGATRFLVWTSINWLVLRIVSGDESEKSHSFISMAQKFSVEAEYSIELDDVYIEKGSQILSVDHDFWDDTTFVRVSSRLEAEHSVNNSNIILLTLKTNDAKPSDSSPIALWPQSLPASNSMALNSSLDQLVFANNSGDIYLSRRRRTRWSQPKLLSSCRTPEKVDTGSSSLALIDRADRNAKSTESSTPAPQAIEIDSDEDFKHVLDKFAMMEDSEILELSKLERQADDLGPNESEIEPTVVFRNCIANQGKLGGATESRRVRATFSSPIKIIRLYFGDRIQVIYLDKSEFLSKSLILPRDVRNVCIESNKSQVRSAIIRPKSSSVDEQLLVVATGRKLLFYSIGQEQLIKSIEAHGGRVLQLLPIEAQDFGQGQCVASASMDKTVSIWNLSNLNKETHLVEKMDGSISYLSLAPQRPLAACLSKGQLGLYDWRTLKSVGRISGQDLEPLEGEPNATIIGCKFSVNSRYLCLSTHKFIHLYSLDGARSPLGSSSRSSDVPSLRSNFARLLPVAGLVRKIKFFLQDSRLLVIMDCFKSSTKRSSDSSDTSNITTTGGSTNDSQATGEHLMSRVFVCCFTIPDGRLLFKVDYFSPIIKSADDSQYLAAAKSTARVGAQRANLNHVRLPVLTKDQLHIVTVEFSAAVRGPTGFEIVMNSSEASPKRRRSSAMVRIPIELNMYSTRDGCLAKSIDLNQLEHIQFQVPVLRDESQSNNKLSASSNHPSARTKERAAPANPNKMQHRVVSIGSDQFTRLKAVTYLERQSVVALIDDSKGSSFLIDVHTRQLVCISSAWNGKVSSDGRHGLSRMFKSASLRKSISVSGQRDAPSSNMLNSDGLQLLEMRHCRPVKTLLSNNQLLKLSGQDLQTTGSNLEITCGFTVPNNLYVYCYNSRLKRILLIRTRDNKLIANYKLSTPATNIKCAGDGYSLVLSHVDGSLTSLAIVDPQQSDTLTRLAQFPSRRKN